MRELKMEVLGGLGHLFVCSFLFYFSNCMVSPAITDVTLEAVCPGKAQCSLAIYLSGFQQAVSPPLLCFFPCQSRYIKAGLCLFEKVPDMEWRRGAG
jgi:hypothetical protein